MSNIKEEKIKVLYIDDEEINLQAFKTTFKYDFDVQLTASTKEARHILSTQPVDIIISDQRMPSETGLDFFTSIMTEYPEPIRILLSAYSDIQLVQEAINKGVIYHYLTKPWDEEYFKNIIRNAFETYSLRKEVKNLQKEIQGLKKDLEITSE
ncbi:response regulator [Cecembia calidifontis]|jgi:response regulator RpfG family c-di-GMP phosphodiesterase|uniref:Response regulator receiver domain-containing protein n=1 Tax=Cecembia calidifontis TaxID=1187080 RepID=A0A4Q7P8W0_9BACT|nr:response regulator [Cecembia calidifontis]RZS96626.1 response regulator receiver domain-containing protein [Cecembia calidifontis]